LVLKLGLGRRVVGLSLVIRVCQYSFNSTIRRAHSSIISYFSFRLTAAYN